MVSLIGSIIRQFCEKCACTCNCAKQIVVVTNKESKKELEMFQRSFFETDQQLDRAIKKIDAQINRIEQEKRVDAQTSIDLGIPVEFHGEMRATREMEERTRLDFAKALCGNDLQEKMDQQKPLSNPEWETLHETVKFVKNFGSDAVLLWKLVRAARGNLVALNGLGIVTKTQAKKIREGIKGEWMSKTSYAQLELDHKKVFLEAAQFFSVTYIHRSFQSLCDIDVENNSLLVESLGLHHKIRPHNHGILSLSDDDEKTPEIDSDLEEFFDTVGGTREEKEDSGRALRRAVGILRAQAIALRLGYDPSKLLESNVAVDEFNKMNTESLNLSKSDGVIFYLYSIFKESIEIEDIEGRQFITKEIAKAIVDEMGAHPDLLLSIMKSGELGALSPSAVAVLWRLSEMFPQKARHDLNQAFSVGKWLTERTDSIHTDSVSEAIFTGSDEGEGGSNPVVED